VTAELFIGLMSGTSLDGVDAVLADFSGASPRVLASAQRFFDSTLRATLLELSAARDGEIERAALAANELSRRYAAAAAEVLAASSVTPSQVVAIGCHGQTIRHRPELGYSVQIGNAALLEPRQPDQRHQLGSVRRHGLLLAASARQPQRTGEKSPAGAGMGAEHDVFLHCESAEQREILECPSDPQARDAVTGHLDERAALEQDRAFLERIQP